MRDLNKKTDNFPNYGMTHTKNKTIVTNYICKAEGHTLGNLKQDGPEPYRVCEICEEKVLEKDISSKDRIEKQKIILKDSRRFL